MDDMTETVEKLATVATVKDQALTPQRSQRRNQCRASTLREKSAREPGKKHNYSELDRNDKPKRKKM